LDWKFDRRQKGNRLASQPRSFVSVPILERLRASPIPERSADSRALRRSQSAPPVPERSTGPGALHRSQSAPPVPERSTDPRALPRSQSAPPVPERSTGPRALHRSQSAPPIPDRFTGPRALHRSQSAPLIPERSTDPRALPRSQSAPPIPERSPDPGALDSPSGNNPKFVSFGLKSVTLYCHTEFLSSECNPLIISSQSERGRNPTLSATLVNGLCLTISAAFIAAPQMHRTIPERVAGGSAWGTAALLAFSNPATPSLLSRIIGLRFAVFLKTKSPGNTIEATCPHGS